MNILITGATSGIGEQVARDYAAAGHQVWVCGRNQEKLSQLAALGDVHPLQFDVTDTKQCQQHLGGLQGLDLVILSAGVCEYIDYAQHFEVELVERVFQANFFGMVNCAQSLLPNLSKGSKLVFIDSMSRLLPFTRAQAYGASKAATFYFAKSLGVDLKPKGIEVVTVSPGFVKTPMTDANDFAMPMRVTVAQASAALRSQLAKGRRTIYFPRVFGWILRFMHKLPTAMQLWLAQRMKD
ncbi:short-chain dehydrogenase [Aliidiomarina sedimenti]|uniref:Short-chain dehydrogenase n=1 Tax=Aliidiomarina sedimenti TaxID=1933879 RepID=A0ABY0C1M1_9GAMM|nr:SDR family NAD(P)-dependent oxidoreductase [Aliidiomarina sedimenti]RUO31681.1 short-chain dehydrogenase [Aliidiomarina sedimenti]